MHLHKACGISDNKDELEEDKSKKIPVTTYAKQNGRLKNNQNFK